MRADEPWKLRERKLEERNAEGAVIKAPFGRNEEQETEVMRKTEPRNLLLSASKPGADTMGPGRREQLSLITSSESLRRVASVADEVLCSVKCKGAATPGRKLRSLKIVLPAGGGGIQFVRSPVFIL